MAHEQVAGILGPAPTLERTHQEVAHLTGYREEQADNDGGSPIDFCSENRESGTALGPVSNPDNGRNRACNRTFPSLFRANARCKRMATEGSLASRKLSEEIGDGIAKPTR